MKNILLLIASCSLVSSMAYARNQQLPTIYAPSTTTTTTSTTTTTVGATIQTIGIQAQNNTNKGQALATAGMAVTAAGAMATCWNPSTAKACKLFVAGLVATTAIRIFMSKASNKSSGTVAAVTVDDPYNLDTGNTGTSNGTKTTTNQTPSYVNEPEWKNAQQTIKKLTDAGWKVDTTTGSITDPSGHKYSSAVVDSAANMQAAGFSGSDIKAFQSAMSKVPAMAAEKTKSADATSDMFGDDAGGAGGGAKAAASADSGLTPYGSLGTGAGSAHALGVNRDPAQVAGMAKDFNGTPIGVSQDSMFQMIDRRYNLHNKNGSFISP